LDGLHSDAILMKEYMLHSCSPQSDLIYNTPPQWHQPLFQGVEVSRLLSGWMCVGAHEKTRPFLTGLLSKPAYCF
jgi:hypothetical protein